MKREKRHITEVGRAHDLSGGLSEGQEMKMTRHFVSFGPQRPSRAHRTSCDIDFICKPSQERVHRVKVLVRLCDCMAEVFCFFSYDIGPLLLLFYFVYIQFFLYVWRCEHLVNTSLKGPICEMNL